MDEEMMDESAVAQAMGFASFGRKRKHSDPAPGGPAAPRDTGPPGTQAPSTLPSRPPPSHLPARPQPPPPPSSSSSGRAQGRGGRGGEVGGGAKWWVGYYDPSSNENPWEFVEKRAGLGSVGPWLARGHARRDRAREPAAGGDAAPGVEG